MALTDIDEQAAETTQRGGLSSFASAPGKKETADQPEVQVAGGMGLFVNIFKALRPINTAPGSPVGARVPEKLGESIQKPGFSYSKTQDAIAKEKLSPEGYEKWVAQGRKAKQKPTEEEVILEEALEAQRAAQPNPSVISEVDQKVADQVLSSVEKANLSIKRGADGGLDFKFNNLETGKDVKALIDAVSETFADATVAAKRGVKTNIQTAEEAAVLLADDLNLTTRLLKKRPGGMLNAAEMTAVRALMARSATELDKLSKAVATGNTPIETMLAFRRQLAIHAGIQMQAKSAQTEIARALQAFRIPVGMDLGPTSKAIADMLESSGGTREAQKLAMSYQKALKTGGQRSANELALKGWAAKGQGIWEEVYVNGLLSWTSTQLKNLFGTPIWMTYRLGQELGAGVAGTIRRGVTGQDDGVYLGEAVARIQGMSQAFKDSWTVASKVYRTEMPVDAISKIEGLSYKNIDATNLNIDPLKHPMWFAAINHLGKSVIRQPGRLLEAADHFWKVGAQRGELYAAAYHDAAVVARRGGTDEQAVDAALMRWMDPRGISEQLDQAARVATLTQDAGTLGKFAKLFQQIPVLGRVLMPFARIPTNTVRLVADSSVLQVINPKAYMDLIGKNGQKAFDRRMGNVAMASATGYMIAEMAVSGRITGGMPRDQKQRNMLPNGWQPYSFVFKGEGWPKDSNGEDLPLFDKGTGLYNGPVTYLNYSGLEPVGAFVGVIAQAVERSRRINDVSKRDDYFTATIWASLDYFMQLPFLDGMASIVHGVERNDLGVIADGPLGSMVGPLPLPYSSAIRNIGNRGKQPVKKLSTSKDLYTAADVENIAADKNKNRDPKEEKIEANYKLVGLPKNDPSNTFLNFLNSTTAMQKKGGFIEDDEQSIAVQYDVLGKVKERGVAFGVNPVVATYNMISPWKLQYGEAPTELMRELVRVGMPLTNSRGSLKGVRLTERQKSDWVNLAKNEVTTNIPGLGRNLSFIVALEKQIVSRAYNDRRTTKQDQANSLKNIEKRFFDAAVEYLISLPGNENLDEAFSDKLFAKEQGLR